MSSYHVLHLTLSLKYPINRISLLLLIPVILRYVPSLLDDNIVSDSRQLAARSEQSMLAYFDGNLKEAAKRGYRQVTHTYRLL
jgi:hypothetical protein